MWVCTAKWSRVLNIWAKAASTNENVFSSRNRGLYGFEPFESIERRGYMPSLHL